MLVVVVEDDPQAMEFIVKTLRPENHHVISCTDGAQALVCLETHEPDILILDYRLLPGPRGLTLARHARNRYPACAICMYSAYEATEIFVEAIEINIDAYILKSQVDSPNEFARLVDDAYVRRHAWFPHKLPDHIEVQNLTVDIATHAAFWYGQPLRLTPCQFDILVQLTAKPGRVYRFSELCWLALGERLPPDRARIKVKSHVANIRRKLEADGRPQTIWSKYGVGYSWEDHGDRPEREIS